MYEHIESLIRAWTTRRDEAQARRLSRRGPRIARSTYIAPRRRIFGLVS
jgi:hypothetical protein